MPVKKKDFQQYFIRRRPLFISLDLVLYKVVWILLYYFTRIFTALSIFNDHLKIDSTTLFTIDRILFKTFTAQTTRKLFQHIHIKVLNDWLIWLNSDKTKNLRKESKGLRLISTKMTIYLVHISWYTQYTLSYKILCKEYIIYLRVLDLFSSHIFVCFSGSLDGLYLQLDPVCGAVRTNRLFIWSRSMLV